MSVENTQCKDSTSIIGVCESLRTKERTVVNILTSPPNQRVYVQYALTDHTRPIRVHVQTCKRATYKNAQKLRTYYVDPQGEIIAYSKYWRRSVPTS